MVAATAGALTLTAGRINAGAANTHSGDHLPIWRQIGETPRNGGSDRRVALCFSRYSLQLNLNVCYALVHILAFAYELNCFMSLLQLHIPRIVVGKLIR